ncbi:hypothetical protein GALMADRAFT_143076 [Galerina marginata CBS 339.88]|uniref:Uncharacterized protein n=1 Tax=Galerina marginata (strain CBS 339.88) TaxID=685588 RepID=A0A067SMR3_GALM3|nr:hypothetical protein GALMADRAFT_143076 [Galerina marginata CBS 339.88]
MYFRAAKSHHITAFLGTWLWYRASEAGLDNKYDIKFESSGLRNLNLNLNPCLVDPPSVLDQLESSLYYSLPDRLVTNNFIGLNDLSNSLFRRRLSGTQPDWQTCEQAHLHLLSIPLVSNPIPIPAARLALALTFKLHLPLPHTRLLPVKTPPNHPQRTPIRDQDDLRRAPLALDVELHKCGCAPLPASPQADAVLAGSSPTKEGGAGEASI